MAAPARTKQSKKRSKKPANLSKRMQPSSWPRRTLSSLKRRKEEYLARRPHRSFRLTNRRDYVRSLKLPGYWAFTFSVGRTLVKHRRLFGSLALLYAIVGAIFVGFASQEAYQQLSDTLSESGKTLLSGGWGELGKAGLLIISGVSGSFAPQLNDVQQVYAGFFALLTWLTAVWLLRAILAGHVPRLRDAIYSAGSPIVATALVLMVVTIQLIPLFLAIIILNVAGSTGILDNGFLSMVFWIISGLLGLVSAYWATSSVVALIIVTLPGMYPWQALRTAGDLVIGRRVRILLRILWLLLTISIAWILLVLPVIFIERGLSSWLPVLKNVPIVPIAISLVTSAAVVWASAYMFLLYRKVVEDDAGPA